MLIKYNLTEEQQTILNQKIITLYSRKFKIPIDYNMKPSFYDTPSKLTVASWIT